MKIVIAGGTGFIGRLLIDVLLQEGHSIFVLTRKEQKSTDQLTYVKWLEEDVAPELRIGHADVFINLAGVSINDGRWTKRHQQQIYTSRMNATAELLRIMNQVSEKPSVWINASAIGIYTASLETVYTEDSVNMANDFLGKTVLDWERKANQAEEQGVRTVLLRFGVVLGEKGGALPLMALPYKFFAGGTVGSGRQWVSWVHIADVVRTIAFAIHAEQFRGPVNVTAPSPVTMKEFGKTIGTVLHRPHWLPMPSFLMKWVLGNKSTLVLEGQRVVPQRLTDEGFEFLYPDLERALENLLV